MEFMEFMEIKEFREFREFRECHNLSATHSERSDKVPFCQKGI